MSLSVTWNNSKYLNSNFSKYPGKLSDLYYFFEKYLNRYTFLVPKKKEAATWTNWISKYINLNLGKYPRKVSLTY